MHNVSSSYFDAASPVGLHHLACLGAWISRRGLASEFKGQDKGDLSMEIPALQKKCMG